MVFVTHDLDEPSSWPTVWLWQRLARLRDTGINLRPRNSMKVSESFGSIRRRLWEQFEDNSASLPTGKPLCNAFLHKEVIESRTTWSR